MNTYANINPLIKRISALSAGLYKKLSVNNIFVVSVITV